MKKTLNAVGIRPEQAHDYFLPQKFADVGKNNYLCRHIGV